MPRFAYTARDSSGQTVSAELEAPSRKDALRMLSARGLQASTVAEQGAGRPAAGRLAQAAGAAGRARPAFSFQLSGSAAVTPGRNERLPFLESLHDLTTSGLSAGEAVRLLSVRIKEPRVRALCAGLWELISEGAPLARAMSNFGGVFDSATVNLIQAGEATG